MRRTVALVRALPRTFAQNAIRADPSKEINEKIAEEQHNTYCDILRTVLGESNVRQVPTRHELADSLFVEDTVVVLRNTKHAIGIKIGAESRREEAEDVWEVLRSDLGVTVHKEKRQGETLDGGDVLYTGIGYIVGLSKRTSPAGAKRFGQLVHELDPKSSINFIKVPYGLHLKSICSMFGPNAIIVSKQCDSLFMNDLRQKSSGMSLIQVPDSDAANCVWIQQPAVGSAVHHSLIIRKDLPQSARILRQTAEELKIERVYECDMSEIAKADGALTCCSVLVDC
jgi:dimethylargininase